MILKIFFRHSLYSSGLIVTFDNNGKKSKMKMKKIVPQIVKDGKVTYK